MEELTRLIKQKKELQDLDDGYVLEKIVSYLDSHPKTRKKLEDSEDTEKFSRSKEYKEMLKSVRKELRAVYGVFQEGDPSKYLDKLEKDDTGAIEKMLSTHTSTRERLPYYDLMYSELQRRLPEPKRIMDIGCGLNPLSIWAYSTWKPHIIASDVSSKDMEFLSKCFEIMRVPNTTVRLDLTKDYEKLATMEADTVFMLKLLDSLEEIERHISYKIFDNLRADWAVVSFPTKSLGGKKQIAKAGRTWFERLLTRKGFGWETFEIPNELFYIVKLSGNP